MKSKSDWTIKRSLNTGRKCSRQERLKTVQKYAAGTQKVSEENKFMEKERIQVDRYHDLPKLKNNGLADSKRKPRRPMKIGNKQMMKRRRSAITTKVKGEIHRRVGHLKWLESGATITKRQGNATRHRGRSSHKQEPTCFKLLWNPLAKVHQSICPVVTHTVKTRLQAKKKWHLVNRPFGIWYDGTVIIRRNFFFLQKFTHFLSAGRRFVKKIIKEGKHVLNNFEENNNVESCYFT